MWSSHHSQGTERVMGEQANHGESPGDQYTELWKYTEEASSKICTAIHALRQGAERREDEMMYLKAKIQDMECQIRADEESTTTVTNVARQENTGDPLTISSEGKNITNEVDQFEDVSLTRKVEKYLKSLENSLREQMEKLHNLLPKVTLEEQLQSESEKFALKKLKGDFQDLKNKFQISENKKEELLTKSYQTEVQLEELEAEVSRLKGQIRARDVVIKDLEKDMIKAQMECDEKQTQMLHLKETQNKFLKSIILDQIRFLMADEMQCAICTDFFDKALTLGCSHTFCEKCLDSIANNLCPLCRQDISLKVATPVIDSLLRKLINNYPDISER